MHLPCFEANLPPVLTGKRLVLQAEIGEIFDTLCFVLFFFSVVLHFRVSLLSVLIVGTFLPIPSPFSLPPPLLSTPATQSCAHASGAGKRSCKPRKKILLPY